MISANDQAWLQNRILAAIDDDDYLDVAEEKRIKEEGAAKGMSIKDIELSVRTTLDKHGAACERLLIEELDRLLHQFTDNDRKLDPKEERDALDKVIRPAQGKKKGLDPRVAEEYVSSFCSVTGIVRSTERNKRLTPSLVVGGLLLAAIAVGGVDYFRKDVQIGLSGASSLRINGQDKAEIDDLISRANQFVEMAQYTDPPEKSAKSCLDKIRLIDPSGEYRSQDVKGISIAIVDHYIALAEKSHADRDIAGTEKWLERAKLLNTDIEVIREKERQLGLLHEEK
jgi:hypothetical protein